MEDQNKTKKELIHDLMEIRQRIAELETLEKKQKQSEKTLRQAEEKYRSLFENAIEGIFQTTSKGEIISANPAFAHIHGYESPEEIIKSDALIGYQLFVDQNCRADYVRLLKEKGTIRNFEAQLYRKDGSIIWVSINARTNRDSGGRFLYYEGSVQDITEHKRAEDALQESEDRYRDLVENTQDFICTHDLQGYFLSVNPATAKLLGYDRSTILKMNVRDILAPEVREQFPSYLDTIQRDGVAKGLMLVQATTGERRILEYNNTLRIEGAVLPIVRSINHDVTERIRAEQALRQSEKRYRLLAENVTDVIWTTDMNLRTTYISPSVTRIRGYSVEEAMSQTIEESMTPSSYELAMKVLAEELVNEKSEYEDLHRFRTLELEETRRDGSTIWTESTITFLRDSDGRAVGILGITRDITERKGAEEELRFFRQLIDRSNDAVEVLKHETGQLLDVNNKACVELGYDRNELLGMTLFDIDPEMTQEKFVRLRHELDESNSVLIESHHRRKDGTNYPVEVNVTVVRLEKTYSVCIVRDITERKKAEEALSASEEKYRMLFEGVAEGILVADIESRKFRYANPAVCKIFGYTQKELTRLGVEDIHPNNVLDYVMDDFDVGARGQKIGSSEMPCLQKDGSVIYASINTSPVVIDGRKYNVGFFTDITERRQIEREKANLEEQLRQSQKIEGIGQLAGGVAHDFNNLLTIIKGYSQLSLTEMKKEDPLKENIEEIKKAADRAADLTRQLLAFSRRQIMELQVLDLNDLLKNLDKMLRRVIGEDIELVTLLAEDLGRVKTDPGQTEQVVMNLLVNARDAMPEGGKLTIETANVELDEYYARAHVAVTPGRYVMLSVSDTGVGIAPEVRQQIFEPFFTTKEKGKGTGMGLSTVYGIVKQSGGNIWVYSELGKGTTFKIYLPRVDEPLEKLGERVEVKEIPCGTETILVVEDEEEVRKLVVRILERQGYKVLEASQGLDAFLIVEKYEDLIHLLVTDVVMPKISGRELADRIAEILPEIKVLYMSGYTDNAIVHHGVLGEGIKFIQKPFTVEGLARKVRELLDKDSPTQTSNG